MDWKFSFGNLIDVVKYVDHEYIQLVQMPHKERRQQRETRAGRRQLIKDIYESLLRLNVNYAYEPFNLTAATQKLRDPFTILCNPKEATCIDLSYLFCSLCLGYELLPVLVILEGHALVLVALEHNLDEYDHFSKIRSRFKRKDEINITFLKELLDSNSYLAVECTGFAKLTTTPGTQPELKGRSVDGFFNFERAIEAGKEQLDYRSLREAIDIAHARFSWSIEKDSSIDVHDILNRFYAFYKLNENLPPTAGNLTTNTLPKEENSTQEVKFLQITIEPNPTVGDFFNLKALIFDDGSFSSQKFNVGYQNIPDEIRVIIDEARKEFRCQINIEVFVTVQCFSLIQSLDVQPMYDEINSDKVPMGQQYIMAIRLYERNFYGGNLYKTLIDRWKKLTEVINNNCTPEQWQANLQAPDELQGKQWKQLTNVLLNKKQLGLKINSGFPSSPPEQGKLAGAILNGGVPICIWNRETNRQLSQEQIDRFEQLLSLEQMRSDNDLYDAILNLRCEAHTSKEPETHIGYHLGFLYDRGDRMPDIKRLARMI